MRSPAPGALESALPPAAAPTLPCGAISALGGGFVKDIAVQAASLRGVVSGRTHRPLLAPPKPKEHFDGGGWAKLAYERRPEAQPYGVS